MTTALDKAGRDAVAGYHVFRGACFFGKDALADSMSSTCVRRFPA